MNEQELLECLAPYLPYDVWCSYNENKYRFKLKGLGYSTIEENEVIAYDGNSDEFYITELKPILKPLSDLTRDFVRNEFNAKNDSEEGYEHWMRVVFMKEYDEMYKEVNYGIIQELFKNHFDVFGLIDKGYAIDKNKLKD